MYHFVVEDPGKPFGSSSADRRRAELQDSDVRAHAAKFAYLKKKARQQITEFDHENFTNPSDYDVAWPEDASTRRSSSDTESWNEEEDRIHGQQKKVQANRRQSKPAPTVKRGPLKTRFRLQPGSLLSQTSKDPFDSYPERRLPKNVEKVVQYGECSQIPRDPRDHSASCSISCRITD